MATTFLPDLSGFVPTPEPIAAEEGEATVVTRARVFATSHVAGSASEVSAAGTLTLYAIYTIAVPVLAAC